MVSRLPACRASKAFPGLARLFNAFLAWPGLAFLLRMRTTLERERCFQEIAFSTLAGFWHHFPFKIRPFFGTKKLIASLLFGLRAALAAFGVSWPPLGLPLASLWPPLASPWPPLGLPLASLGLAMGSLGLPLGSLGLPLTQFIQDLDGFPNAG